MIELSKYSSFIWLWLKRLSIAWYTKLLNYKVRRRWFTTTNSTTSCESRILCLVSISHNTNNNKIVKMVKCKDILLVRFVCGHVWDTVFLSSFAAFQLLVYRRCLLDRFRLYDSFTFFMCTHWIPSKCSHSSYTLATDIRTTYLLHDRQKIHILRPIFSAWAK